MDCSICGKISGTGNDHTDCVEKRRIEMEDQDFKLSIPERLDLEKNPNDVSTDIKAILNHMKKDST